MATLIVFSVHPALRPVPAVLPPSDPAPARRVPLRQAVVILLGLAAGAALLLALVLPFTRWVDPAQRGRLVAALIGCVVLSVLSPPCLGAFALWTALRPRVSRATTAGWILGAGFYGFLTWLSLVYVHWNFG